MAPFRPLPFLLRDTVEQVRADGVLVLSHRSPLKPIEPHIPGLLRRNAAQRPDHAWLAQRRGPERQWTHLAYGQAQTEVDALTQALLDLHAPGRPVMVLSGNSIEHAQLALAAMQARMPIASVTPAYALLSHDLAKLKAMMALLDPAVVFVQNGDQFERALRGLDRQRALTVTVEAAPPDLECTAWTELLATRPHGEVAASVAGITPDTVAKYLFTSGSTGMPKAVTVTQRMLCTSMAMHSQMIDWGPDRPETVLLDWLPWSHVAGGSAVFNSVLEDGGTLYIDEGRPLPGAFDETLRNLREVSPVRFSSVPVGYAMLAEALEHDDTLGACFFRHLRRMTYSGARLPDSVQARMQAQAVHHTGFRIPFVSAFGSTETSASATYVHWLTERAGLIGLPQPGVSLKLVPIDGVRYEVRVRSDAVTPGYLGRPDLSAQVFDDEGYLRMGDAATFVDPGDIDAGLAFAGRVAEEFKLQSGVFVRVGALRVEAINAAAPWLSDVVVTGADRDRVGLLAWPNLAICRARLGLPAASVAQVLASTTLRAALEQAFQVHNRSHPGSSQQVRRLLLLEEPASMDAGEITDKGYVNQRAVLERRSALVECLHAEQPPQAVLCID